MIMDHDDESSTSHGQDQLHHNLASITIGINELRLCYAAPMSELDMLH